MSWLPFELLLALRYLRPKRTFVSFITLISIIGVTLGVAVLIVVIAVMSGFDEEWHKRILGFNAHLRVEKFDDSPMSDYAAISAMIRESPNVVGVSPYIEDQALVETQPRIGEPRAVAPLIRGIDPATEGQVTVLPDSLVAGTMELEDDGILVGSSFARNMGLMVGDRVSIYARREFRLLQKLRDDPEAEIPIPDDYEVRGIFEADFFEYDNMWVFTSLEAAQLMNDWSDQVKGLSVRLDDDYKAYDVYYDLAQRLGPEFGVIPWMAQHREIFDSLQMEKNLIRYLLFFIVLVAAFGITSSLITFVVQKTREIGALRSMGASSLQIMNIFLMQCVVVGAVGVGIGYSLGMIAIKYRNEFMRFLNDTLDTTIMPSSVYQLGNLPALILPGDVISICGFSLLICLVAGLVPAWIAARLKPVEALRHE